jgi:hypothetical protein
MKRRIGVISYSAWLTGWGFANREMMRAGSANLVLTYRLWWRHRGPVMCRSARRSDRQSSREPPSEGTTSLGSGVRDRPIHSRFFPNRKRFDRKRSQRLGGWGNNASCADLFCCQRGCVDVSAFRSALCVPRDWQPFAPGRGLRPPDIAPARLWFRDGPLTSGWLGCAKNDIPLCERSSSRATRCR